MLLEAIPAHHACVRALHCTALSGCSDPPVGLLCAVHGAARGGLPSGWFACARGALNCIAAYIQTQHHAACNVQRSAQQWPLRLAATKERGLVCDRTIQRALRFGGCVYACGVRARFVLLR